MSPGASALTREIVRKPIRLQTGESLIDRHLVIEDSFRWNQLNAVVYVGADDVTIKNVRITGASEWLERWNLNREPRGGPPGIPSQLVGIRMKNPRRLSIEDVAIEGLPRHALYGYGIREGVFRNIQVVHCWGGIRFAHNEPSHEILIEDIHARDLWGPGPGRWVGIGDSPRKHGGHPSSQRRGGYIGGDGLALGSLRNAAIRNCTTYGEQFGSFKVTNAQNVEISGLRGIGLMVQGTQRRDISPNEEPSRNVHVHDCIFDKSLGKGAVARWGNCIQVAQNVETLLIERCRLVSAGTDGHGIQFTRNAHGRVVDCTFVGFNGRRGPNPAHAADLAHGSSVNADFTEANHFIDQKRILLNRN